MCEDTKCMHHVVGGARQCKKGLKMVCKRRYKKLGLKYTFVDIVGKVNDGI